jgi:hypothetical protein
MKARNTTTPLTRIDAHCTPHTTHNAQFTCGAVELPTEEEAPELLRLQAGMALVGRQEVVLYCVGWPQQCTALKARQRAQQRELQPLWQTSAEALQIQAVFL